MAGSPGGTRMALSPIAPRERTPMRTVLVFTSLLGLAGLTSAAPIPAGQGLDEAARKQLHDDALTYASQTLSVATQVSAGYIRPVARIDLLDTAIRGLFE